MASIHTTYPQYKHPPAFLPPQGHNTAKRDPRTYVYILAIPQTPFASRVVDLTTQAFLPKQFFF